MKIGIISDTHKKPGRTRRAIELLVKQGAQAFIHAGDIVMEENLRLLEETALPYVAVFGNNDAALLPLATRYPLYQEPSIHTWEGLSFKVMHYPYFLRPAETDLIVFGHTHIKAISFDGRTLTLNPGEVCARDTGRSECMLLTVTPERFVVDAYARPIKTDEWNHECTEFLR